MQNHLTLIVGSIVAISILALCLEVDPWLCLADERISVILVLNFEVCKVGLSGSEMDGYPSTIEHPPKWWKPESEGYNIGELTGTFNTPGFDYPGFFFKKQTRNYFFLVHFFLVWGLNDLYLSFILECFPDL